MSIPSHQIRPSFSRRHALAGLGLAGLTLAISLHATTASAQRREGPAEVPVEELMKPGDLPELAIGPADAKVVVIEYASMTCGHCATFHNDVYPKFKAKYVETGKVRFIQREFPLDNLAAAASMLARCAGGGNGQDATKSVAMIETLFLKQADWAFVRTNPVPKLFEIAKQAGFTQDSFDKCLTDQKLLESVTKQREHAAKAFGISSTPTFFINGKRLQGGASLENLEKAINPLLEAGK